MKPIHKILFLIVISVLFCSCTASVSYLNEGVNKYPPTEKSSIKIYSVRELPKETIEIGYVAVNMTDMPDGDTMKETLKASAAKLGADAIINFQILGNTAEGIAVKYK